MEGNFLTKVVIPIALAFIMLGVGFGLTMADFRRVAVMPRAVLVGLFCHTVLLPIACYGIVVAFGLPPELGVGLMILAATPGGASANIFSHLAHADVALNVTLTATNSLLSLLTLPLTVELDAWYLHHMREVWLILAFQAASFLVALGLWFFGHER